MQTFNAGGDINISQSEIIDQSTIYKPFEQCSNDELIQDRQHRRNLIKKEKERKDKISMPFFIATCILFGVTFLLAEVFEEYVNPLIAGLTALGAFGSLWAIKEAQTKTEFEARQEATIKKISFILREREVE